jgi:hypothetical protein
MKVMHDNHVAVELKCDQSLTKDIPGMRAFVNNSFPDICYICRDHLRYEFELNKDREVSVIKAYTYWRKESKIKQFWHKYYVIASLVGLFIAGISFLQIVFSLTIYKTHDAFIPFMCLLSIGISFVLISRRYK